VKRGGRLKRTEIKRGTKRLQRKKRMRRVNPENAARLEERNFAAPGRLVRTLPCCACRKPGPSQACHYLTRGSKLGDKRDLFPACPACHREQERLGVERFEALHAFDGFKVGDVICATLAEVASYVQDAVRDHLCYEWPELHGGRARCLVCRAPIDDPEACTP
jgi:hypothetical protein